MYRNLFISFPSDLKLDIIKYMTFEEAVKYDDIEANKKYYKLLDKIFNKYHFLDEQNRHG